MTAEGAEVTYKQSSTMPYLVVTDVGDSVCFCQKDDNAKLIAKALNMHIAILKLMPTIERLCREIQRDADEPDMVMQKAEVIVQAIKDIEGLYY